MAVLREVSRENRQCCLRNLEMAEGKKCCLLGQTVQFRSQVCF